MSEFDNVLGEDALEMARTPGTKWTEADYEEHGYKRIKFTFPAHVANYLAERSQREGVSRQAFLIALLEAELEAEPKSKPRKK